MRLLVLFLILFCSLGLKANPLYDSTKDGRYNHYDDSSRLVFSGKYKSGLRHGTFKEYDSQGFLLRKTKYRHGKMLWSQRYENGKMVEVTDKRGRVRKTKNCGC